MTLSDDINSTLDGYSRKPTVIMSQISKEDKVNLRQITERLQENYDSVQI